MRHGAESAGSIRHHARFIVFKSSEWSISGKTAMNMTSDAIEQWRDRKVPRNRHCRHNVWSQGFVAMGCGRHGNEDTWLRQPR